MLDLSVAPQDNIPLPACLPACPKPFQHGPRTLSLQDTQITAHMSNAQAPKPGYSQNDICLPGTRIHSANDLYPDHSEQLCCLD